MGLAIGGTSEEAGITGLRTEVRAETLEVDCIRACPESAGSAKADLKDGLDGFDLTPLTDLLNPSGSCRSVRCLFLGLDCPEGELRP